MQYMYIIIYLCITIIICIAPPDDALQSTDTIEESFLKYRAICEYEVNDPSQVGFPEGAILTVIDQDEDGL